MASGDALHVTNGDSTVGTLRETSLGGEQLAWRDALHEGPVPAVPEARLRELRAAFLGDRVGLGDSRRILRELGARDRIFDEALAEGRHVVLWFEHDLYDQLQLLQILARVGERSPDLSSLELICVGSFPGIDAFHGLGQLAAAQLQSLWSARRPVTSALVEAAGDAWAAVRSPEPAGIAAIAEGGAAELPFLPAALRRLLEELPSARDGLARGERQLLEGLRPGPRTPAQLFAASQEREEAPFAGDFWVWRWLARLGGAAEPLVAAADGGPLPAVPGAEPAGRFTSTPLALTDAGRAVLAGSADAVDLLGIDRWVGGTHLRDGNVWRHDGSAGRVVPPPP